MVCKKTLDTFNSNFSTNHNKIEKKKLMKYISFYIDDKLIL